MELDRRALKERRVNRSDTGHQGAVFTGSVAIHYSTTAEKRP